MHVLVREHMELLAEVQSSRLSHILTWFTKCPSFAAGPVRGCEVRNLPLDLYESHTDTC